MAGKTTIIDGYGTEKSARVESGGYIRTLVAGYPPSSDKDLQVIYRQFLTLNGDTVTSDMRVNGATTSQTFYIQAEPDVDIYITNLSILLADTNTNNSFNTFGDLTALTNGCRIYYEDQNGQINIGTSIQTNFDFIRLCLGTPAFGGRASAGGAIFNPFFLPDAVGTTADAIIPVLNLATIFGLTYGIRLGAGTTNRLALEVNDDLSGGLDAFNVIVYGFKRILTA